MGPEDDDRRVGRGRGTDAVVTPGVLMASTWAWRLLAITVAVVALGWVLRYLSEVVVPVVVGALFTALLAPVVTRLHRWGLPRGVAAGISLVGAVVLVAGLLALVGTQIGSSFADLSDQVGQGISQLRDLARVNFGVTDADIQQALGSAKDALTSSGLGSRAAKLGTSATHFVAGAFIALFATFFFLFEGEQIWCWLVRLMPRRARERTDSSGRRAWLSLTAYVRATIIVAFVDAIGITIGARALGLPLVAAIGILVFVGAFVPIVGAFVSGLVAVLIALVAQGPVHALDHVARGPGRAADRSPRAATVPARPTGARASARGDPRDRHRGDHGRHRRRARRGTDRGHGQRRRAPPRRARRAHRSRRTIRAARRRGGRDLPRRGILIDSRDATAVRMVG
ncbi:MAG: AI-2E family transporter [Intrasporangium sp.]|nr:AI-2E family transporter [Intrasporangium sp.]MDN5797639.1 AI-2E family transporter [Intrasporangium sp.]